ncbi:hypothetical protein NSS70_03435 [Aeribacillus sp. FSL K6-2848]
MQGYPFFGGKDGRMAKESAEKRRLMNEIYPALLTGQENGRTFDGTDSE